MKSLLGIVLLSLFALTAACGNDLVGDCLSTCSEAQDRDCTSIDNCNDFCVSGASLADSGGCTFELNSYESCAERSPVCSIDAQCGAEQNALASCIGVYCLANSSNPDCARFRNSF